MEDGRDYVNLHEASFIVGLRKYLVQQGYATTQVTIVTMYSGQMKKIKEMLLNDEPSLKGIRVTTVDNFHGEENDIILVSFVRSNAEKAIEMLKKTNGANLMLPRSRKGLFCIGNFKLMAELCEGSNEDHFSWHKLVEKLKKEDVIGDALEIHCQNHGTKNTVKTRDEFLKKAPEGGCLSMCDTPLNCGHTCLRACHVLMDSGHVQGRCQENCNKTCIRGHPCPAKCHHPNKCTKCYVEVGSALLDCQHTVPIVCSDDPAAIRCNNKCERDRCCGHKCMGLCSEDCDDVICNEMAYVNSQCGHTVSIKCSDTRNYSKHALLKACTEYCNKECSEGHKCPDKCHYPQKCGKCVPEVESTWYVPFWIKPSDVPRPNNLCSERRYILFRDFEQLRDDIIIGYSIKEPEWVVFIKSLFSSANKIVSKLLQIPVGVSCIFSILLLRILILVVPFSEYICTKHVRNDSMQNSLKYFFNAIYEVIFMCFLIIEGILFDFPQNKLMSDIIRRILFT